MKALWLGIATQVLMVGNVLADVGCNHGRVASYQEWPLLLSGAGLLAGVALLRRRR